MFFERMLNEDEPDVIEVRSRWGTSSDAGFTAVPNTMIKAQAELGLSDGELVVLLNLAMHWWSPSGMPFPRSEAIARRMGTSARTVQRHLKSLEERELVKKVSDNKRTYIDMTGLREKLEEITPRHAWKYDKPALAE